MKLSAQERQSLLLTLYREHLVGERTQGELLRTLRKQVLGFNQTEYAELVGVSRRTLSDIERDSGSPTQAVLTRVFKPFSLKPGLVLAHPQLVSAFLSESSAQASDNEARQTVATFTEDSGKPLSKVRR
ncbi:transcriptional regulator with XRE-family HTH domain [Litorivivens lipolytica]|uniref:Transcriptional regulator with XRE-family HTH domain n=1 Tax=Litorivivens lipolytica TaxID=1524264 RepID=A0A7W4W8L3_9GAMM|nr:transcriptional regulator with XRE-family HTH domain [Litorivivens lipolytica]